jgi:hypothetical protein
MKRKPWKSQGFRVSRDDARQSFLPEFPPETGRHVFESVPAVASTSVCRDAWKVVDVSARLLDRARSYASETRAHPSSFEIRVAVRPPKLPDDRVTVRLRKNLGEALRDVCRD